METGDPKQVAVLSILAVGALGFLFTRVGGKSAPQAHAAAANARTAASRPFVALTLTRDPFSHPRLATKPEKPSAPAPNSPSATTPSVTPLPSAGKAAPFSMMGSLPAADGEGEIEGPLAPSLLKEKNAAKKKKTPPPAPVPTSIGLEAIAGASDAVAFLAVGNAESRPFHPNDRIDGAIRLLSVGDGAVVLAGPKGKLTLNVGERKSL